MKIIFLSNFISPHTYPLAEQLFKIMGNDFRFIETKKMSSERKQLGYEKFKFNDYVVSYEDFCLDKEHIMEQINLADVVLISYGSVDVNLIRKRIAEDRLTFLMSERIFKKGFIKILDRRFWQGVKLFHDCYNKNIHLLCMGSYVADDFRKCGFNPNHIWKFGYFTKTNFNLNVKDLYKKERNAQFKILWVGRMIWWKRPMQFIKMAEQISKKYKNIRFCMVGSGKQFTKLEKYVDTHNLKNIELCGLVDNSMINDMYIDADLFVATSNRLEGWGAVINEAANCGSLIVASSDMGSVGYLIKDGVSGFVYHGGYKKLIEAVERAINDSSANKKRVNAYLNISRIWCAENAALKLCTLIENISSNKPYMGTDSGDVCERA